MKLTALALALAVLSIPVAADDAPATAPILASPALQAPAAAQAVTEADLFAPAAGCEAPTPVLADLGAEEPAPMATIPCGSCSSANCRGATRGQTCHLGSGQGFGNCNIFSGGYLCPTGGWACSCSRGILD